MDKEQQTKRQPDKEAYEILGEHKSSAQLKAERRAEKEKIKQQLREEIAERKKNRAATKEPNTVIWVMVGILAFVVIGAGVLMGVNFYATQQAAKKEIAADSGHFIQDELMPELSQEGIKAVINEAYYTNDGHLAVKMTLSNGLDTKHYLTSLEIKLYNGEEQVIATGYTDAIPEDYAVPAMGYNTFTLHISPEYIQIADDPLETLSYEIRTVGQLEDTTMTTQTDAPPTTTEAGTTAAATTAE